ncbi:hypothetical protein EZV73_15095 [Acidaminobacter sp. JC074]|uniref:hypothetical protein n=1 Tax=Acidaminobacter sp. JC074 TaxID=2530199 RepID=UPI001F11520E|nr:hypothetical protein [Acidaminobacter sp. JC074]MCH4888920.1 hypothetical protein [Acidaminobacter sp. JC074]
MFYRYELNYKLFELCVELSNSYRWNGMMNLKTILTENEEHLEENLFDFLDYGITLLIDGRSPENVKLFAE